MKSVGWGVILLLIASPARAQMRAGAIVAGLTQSQSEDTLGGTVGTASVVFGVEASPRIALEVEVAFTGGPFESDYVYSPKPGAVRVTLSRRDTFFLYQLRWRVEALELVAGAGYVHGRTARHARFVASGATYFHQREIDHGLALTAGADIAIPVAARIAVVPHLRVIVRPGGSPPEFADSTYPGKAALRYGVGVRMAF